MAKKLPYFPFFTGDWLKDDALTLCTPATRGVWIDLLARMHERDRSGELCGTADQLARAARCSTVEFVHAATDLQATGAADVVERNGQYVIRNRRMYAESNARKAAADRQMRRRHDSCNDVVTPDKRNHTEYEHENEIENEIESEVETETETAFDRFWSVVPKKEGKQAAKKAYRKAVKYLSIRPVEAGPGSDDPNEFLFDNMALYAQSPLGRSKFCVNPTRWLNEGKYDDDQRLWQRGDDSLDPRGTYRELQNYLISESDNVQ